MLIPDRSLPFAAVLAIALLVGCSPASLSATGGAAGSAQSVALVIQPASTEVISGGAVDFSASVYGTANPSVVWMVAESGGGAVDAHGHYQAPQKPGTYHVRATTPGVDAPVAVATVTVTDTAPTTTVTSDPTTTTAPTTTTVTSDPTTTTAPTTTTVTSAPTTNSVPTPAPSPGGVVAAFPGAEGGGAVTVGGRGGKVYVVNSLGDDHGSGCGPSGVGTCTLRACVEAYNYGSTMTAADGVTGQKPRTCVFAVSGTITGTSMEYIVDPYITIAGQTAPGGIALVAQGDIGASIGVGTYDVIVRYMRLWGKDNGSTNAPNPGSVGIEMWSGARKNVVVDHCTMLWHTTESINVWNDSSGTTVGHFTFSWNLIGEQVRGTQDVVTYIGSPIADPSRQIDMTLPHNVMVSGQNRVPELEINGGHFVNNLTVNYERAFVALEGGTLDIVGNQWKTGNFGVYNTSEIFGSGTQGSDNGSDPYIPSYFSFYLAQNKADARSRATSNVAVTGTEPDGGWSVLTSGSNTYQSDTSDQSLTPLPTASQRVARLCGAGESSGCVGPSSAGPYPSVTPVSSLESVLTASGAAAGASAHLDCSGNWVALRDSAESRIFGYVVDPSSSPASYPTTTNYGSPLPTLTGGTACTDTDGDGMPDAYETAHGLNPNDPSDGALVASDGYTNLEHFLAGY